ncbi:MAG: autotransporter outer membrane beta-barrel domain-containing protein [Puniceicoccales bacterium]|jgi:uncharacterized protein with beta-barrel porin domain|nr:autotransporter outer membrane beta-barrel domain-containing protein [Puniceicoccales bacterium]
MKKISARCFLSAATLVTAAVAIAPAPQLDARPHNGLGNYVQLLDAMLGNPGYDWNSMPGWYFNNTSSISFGVMGNLPALTSAGEVSGILRQLDSPHYVKPLAQRRREVDAFYGTETGSLDGRHPAQRGEWQTYAFGQWNFGDFDSSRNRPVCNPETWGGLVGAHRWIDDERLIGASVSYNFARAKLHDGGGRIDGGDTRLRLYAALVPEGRPWWVAFGASGGYVSYKTIRLQADPFGPLGIETDPNYVAKASPTGYEVGVFAALNTRIHISENLLLTPVARVDYNSTSMKRFTESGAQFAWNVNRFNSDSVQTRLGAGLEFNADAGWFLLKAGCTVAWASELAGNDIKITSAFANYPGSKHYTYAGQLFQDAVEINPSVSIVFKNGIVLEGAWNLQITFDAQFSQSVSGSIGWRF